MAAGHPGHGDTWAFNQSDWTVVVTIPLGTDSCWRLVVEFVLGLLLFATSSLSRLSPWLRLSA